MSFKIIEVFVKLREMLSTNSSLKLEVEYIKKRLENHDKNMEIVFQYLDELLEKKDDARQERNIIGYKIGGSEGRKETSP